LKIKEKGAAAVAFEQLENDSLIMTAWCSTQCEGGAAYFVFASSTGLLK